MKVEEKNSDEVKEKKLKEKIKKIKNATWEEVVLKAEKIRQEM